MPNEQLAKIIEGVVEGRVVPYLGAGVLSDVTNKNTGEKMPADSDSLIIALNGGQPMAPKLMFEFARAAMNVELKRGRTYVSRFLDELYAPDVWTRARVHQWIEALMPPYVIDINRDTQLQQSYASEPHTLVRGLSRIAGTDYRFQIHHYDGTAYKEIDQKDINPALPILFKPHGSPLPTPTFIASDADYVDYITELMGGFAIPDVLKGYRRKKQYLFLGMRFIRDTERMVMSDIVYDAGDPVGWVVLEEPTPKEERYCKRMNIEIIRASLEDFLETAGVSEKTQITSAA